MTRGVNDLASEDEGFARFVYESLKRYRQGAWGDLAEQDKKENDFSLEKNLRLLSAYKRGNHRIWIITEADRSVTTILFPEEY